MASRVPPNQAALARKYGAMYGVDPQLLLAIGGHETEWGRTGAGRPSQGGYTLGYGVTDSGIISKYRGVENQYRYAAQTLASWGVHSIGDVMAGKASRYATDPNWEQAVAKVYSDLGGPSVKDRITDHILPQPQGGLVGTRVAPAAAPAPAETQYITVPRLNRRGLASGIFSTLAAGETPDIPSLIDQSWGQKTMEIPPPPRAPSPPPVSDASPPNMTGTPAATPTVAGGWQKYVVAGQGMDRKGVPTRPEVLQFVGKIGAIFGQPLTIGTGTNHGQYVKGGQGRVSDHWYGVAADIPMTGAALTRLGQDALIAAGMPVALARKQRGGVFNIGGYNILFNTNVGGNHYNHLHVGMGRILGRPD